MAKHLLGKRATAADRPAEVAEQEHARSRAAEIRAKRAENGRLLSRARALARMDREGVR